MRLVLPPDLRDVDQPSVRVIDERRRVRRLASPLTGSVMKGDAVQFVMDERSQAIECTPIAAAPGR